jgi:UDP-GlcNAc3NAcA epimerase
MKVVTILGARPQFIKAAAVSRSIYQHNLGRKGPRLKEVIVHTGQHFDANMSAVFFEQLGIPLPEHCLSISSLSHGAMTGRMMEKIEELLQHEAPDWVMVYGDTNTTLAGSLAAVKLPVPVAHVEAGLRSHNMAMPEEINRALTDRVSDLLLCPTLNAVDNLYKEGYPFSTPRHRQQRIENVGDVMFDAVLHYRDRARAKVNLSSWGVVSKSYALCTLHRQENTDDPVRLNSILGALRAIAMDLPVLLPLHPRTRNLLEKKGNTGGLEGLQVIDPIPYLEMQRLQMDAKVILTDSGGMQKEAFFHSVPCITLRDETEWVETVTGGWNQLSGAEEANIVEAYKRARTPSGQPEGVYGDGDAASRIIQALLDY